MKRILFILIAAVLMYGTTHADDKKYAQASFPEKSHDFGIIKEENGPVNTTFEIVNTGNKPLIITDVTVSCGCTGREYTKKPIAPGKSGKVKITYNPAGRPGAFKKSIKVRTNGREKRTTLTIQGTTIPSSEDNKES